jgi:hypothetical protein
MYAPSLHLTFCAILTSIYPKVLHLGLHSVATNGNVGLVKYALSHATPMANLSIPFSMAYIARGVVVGGNDLVVRLLIGQGADVNASRYVLLPLSNPLPKFTLSTDSPVATPTVTATPPPQWWVLQAQHLCNTPPLRSRKRLHHCPVLSSYTALMQIGLINMHLPQRWSLGRMGETGRGGIEGVGGE